MDNQRCSTQLDVKVHAKQTGLSRAAIEISGDFSKHVATEILFAAFDLDKRGLDDRIKPYTLTVGFIETTLNIADVNAMAQADFVPEHLEYTTRDKAGNVISVREFTDLRFRASSCGYSVTASGERPVHKIVYDAVLANAVYYQVEA